MISHRFLAVAIFLASACKPYRAEWGGLSRSSSGQMTIDLSSCNITKGCVVNPPDCKQYEDCTHIVTWSLLPDKEYVRFEMVVSNAFSYIAFGLSTGEFMANTSVLACAYNYSNGQIEVFNSHNEVNNTVKPHYANVITEQPQLGLRPVMTNYSDDRVICIVDRAVQPDPSLNGIIFPLDQPWYPAWASGPTENGLLQYHSETKRKYDAKVVCTGPYGPASPSIDLTTCGSMKGCRRYPEDCSPSGNCSQIVTWRVSPDDSSFVRFEMATITNFTDKEVDYIAFGLAAGPDMFMANTSVLVCAFNKSSSTVIAYLAHNANHTDTILPPHLATVGLNLVSWQRTGSFIQCVIDRAIEPSPQQEGLAFPLNEPWLPAIAAGPTNPSTGEVEHHVFAHPYDEAVTLTDYSNGTTIDVTQCNVTRGCLLNPPGCNSFDECTQIVTWRLLENGEYVRFEMSTVRSHEYIAFGLSVGPDQIMGNTSVLACAYNQTTSKLAVFNSHNEIVNTSSGLHFLNILASEPQLGLEPVTLTATNDRIICVVDRIIKPYPAQNGFTFPLDEPWYPAWAVGPTDNGFLHYHGDTKQKYVEPVICTHDISPPNQPTTTSIPPVGPNVDLKLCDQSKGCWRYPADCSPSENCSQIVTWTVSPDDPAAVRFEMSTVLTVESQSVQYVAFGLSTDLNEMMMNTSVIVCAVNVSDSRTATAYLSHNAGLVSTPLSPDLLKVGVTMIRSEVGASYVFCVVDRKILPTPQQDGLVFPLYMSFYPALAVGPTDDMGYLKKHIFVKKLDSPVTATDFTMQTDIDVSLCGIGRGCLLNPPDCLSVDECYQVISWNVLQSGEYVRFQMSTTRTHEYIAFGLADSQDKAGFMGNGSVLACVMNGTEMIAYHSHNHQFLDGFKSSITNDPMIGIRPMLTVAGDNRIMCVLDQTVHPDPSLNGIIFPLDQPWYVAWATGPVLNGLLTYHQKQRQDYPERVVLTTPFSPPRPPVMNKELMKKLHAVFMMIGWMVCAGCSILTPRFLRKYWTEPFLGTLQKWFVIHRALMILGVIFVIIGFWLILAVDNYMIIDMGPGYPDVLHPYFGLIAIIVIFLNPIVAMFRCKPGHEHRRYFNYVHGTIGGIGFAFALANLITGSVMLNGYNGSKAMYPIIVWACLHALVEVTYLLVWWINSREDDSDESLPFARSSNITSPNYDPSGAASISSLGDIENPPKTISEKLSNIIFVGYFVCTVVLTIAACSLIFVGVKDTGS